MRLNELIKKEQEKEVQRMLHQSKMTSKLTNRNNHADGTSTHQQRGVNSDAETNSSIFPMNKSLSAYNLNMNHHHNNKTR